MIDARGNRRYRCPGRIAADGGGGGGCGCYQVHADDLEAQAWKVVGEALSRPDLLLGLAEDQAQAAAETRGVSDADLAALDRKIARLERAAGESLAKALAAGTDPAVAAAAGLALNGELAAAREQRKTLAAWAADASERRSRAATVADIAVEASDALAGLRECHGETTGARSAQRDGDSDRLVSLRVLPGQRPYIGPQRRHMR